MVKELMYQSPKREAGKQAKSSWINENDTASRKLLESRGWKVIKERELGDKPTPVPPTDPAPPLLVGLVPVNEPAVLNVSEVFDLFEQIDLTPEQWQKVREFATGRLITLTDYPRPRQTPDDQPPPDPVVLEWERVIAGLTVEQIAALGAAGYDNAEKLRQATDEQLRDVKGIGPAAVRDLRKALAAPGA